MPVKRWLFSDEDDDETPGVSVPAATSAEPEPAPTKIAAPAPIEIELPPEPLVLSVSQLNAAIQGTLQAEFSSISVSGEISEISRPHSGHVYFTLKDDSAQVRAILWRTSAQRLKFELEEGQQVICRGDIDVYPPRGTYQLVVKQIEPQGIGALQLAFRQLQLRLAAEGLFNPARKRQLPRFPRRIGFVTSPSGAAIHDFVQVIRRRFKGVQLLVIPAKVQGQGAAAEIVRGIQLANRLRPSLDVLVVGRGGGSIEDLWCFNEEPVVRAIFASRVPVVSAVGHEIDVTLADLVADVRALTPTEAAERVVPSATELREQLNVVARRMKTSLATQLISARRHLQLLASRRVLTHPLDRIHERARRLDELSSNMDQAIRRKVKRQRDSLLATAARLESLSPLQVLTRGYSVTQRSDGSVVRDAAQLSIGETLTTRLLRGEVVSKVERIPEATE
ncbi:Exodeoxyribonuclease 7 large subunit [Anatilimnocola aggregata]|uniref:Exodeoxyribonuclease 7 large subunit n=1 Tax=Anatilimnocola aggregata TaxID=2528021 RepID=A0A517YAX3_9BACT|nr:exodeoxyribonuclease VII large subunit [Anatilimnocola aggregata]QDU27312.1 Exodeoxyribonuclease 7 large subunit [Anatilimnocola aggregata]